jgi:threonine/homoserine/homoserine lactone efflux protein
MIFLILLKGILTGLLLTVYVGATFFTVMETVLRRGVWAALLLNAGVWISDIGCIVLAYMVLQS